MRVLRHAASDSELALAAGSFDGVHLGHAALMRRVCEVAKARGLQSAVMTFDPLPREFFAPDKAPARLTSLAERLALIAATGIEVAIVQRFDRRFAALTAEQFAERLARHHRARWIAVGENFRYGQGRCGDPLTLAEAGRRLGFESEAIDAISDSGEAVSSTRIRAALAAGDFTTAARLLGRPYAICGRVVHGAKRGREMGYPTANVRLARPKPALHGIFAIHCRGAASGPVEGVASLGTNPAIRHGGPATLEAFLFDYSGNLYGRRLAIEFHRKLRDEAAFTSLEELAAQIARDCDAARRYFHEFPAFIAT